MNCTQSINVQFDQQQVIDTMLDGIFVLDNLDVVILTSTGIPYTSKFSHYTKQGKLIKKYYFNSLINKGQSRQLSSVQKNQVIFLLAEINKIGIINFRTGQQRLFDFMLINPQTFKNRLIVFTNSKKYVIYEYPNFNSKYGKFTFFSYPNKKFWSIQIQDTFTYNIQPLNEYNSLVFFRQKVEQKIQFFVINCDKKQVKRYYTAKPTVDQYKIIQIIELTPGQFYIYFQTQNHDYKHQVFDCVKHDQQIEGVLRKLNTTIPQKLYKVMFCGQYLYFFIYEFDEKKIQKALPASILLMKRNSEQIALKMKVLIRYDYNYWFTKEEGENKMYLCIHQYHNCKQIQIKIQTFPNGKQIKNSII